MGVVHTMRSSEGPHLIVEDGIVVNDGTVHPSNK